MRPPPHWDLRWSSLWGYETCEGCAESKRNEGEEGGGGGGGEEEDAGRCLFKTRTQHHRMVGNNNTCFFTAVLGRLCASAIGARANIQYVEDMYMHRLVYCMCSSRFAVARPFCLSVFRQLLERNWHVPTHDVETCYCAILPDPS